MGKRLTRRRVVEFLKSLFCGLDGCGGRLRLTYWPGYSGCDQWLTYEVWCEECKTCDCDGHATLVEVVREAPRFFNARKRQPAAALSAASVPEDGGQR